jgi:hypothetical protein
MAVIHHQEVPSQPRRTRMAYQTLVGDPPSETLEDRCSLASHPRRSLKLIEGNL